jgi:hypothetical protein
MPTNGGQVRLMVPFTRTWYPRGAAIRCARRCQFDALKGVVQIKRTSVFVFDVRQDFL